MTTSTTRAELAHSEALRRLLEECERANKQALDAIGMGLIDLNAIHDARTALAAAPVAAAGDAWREHFMAGYQAAEDDAKHCEVPPPGWVCTRERGHDGPCAAVEDVGVAECVARGMDRLREGAQPAPSPAQAPAQAAAPGLTYSSTQATTCAGCGQHKHTPLRIDAMGGYVCLTCIDQKLGRLLGEFGAPDPTDDDIAQLSDGVRVALAQPREGLSENLHRFLDAAAGEGLVLDDVDAQELYIETFPDRYAAGIGKHEGQKNG